MKTTLALLTAAILATSVLTLAALTTNSIAFAASSQQQAPGYSYVYPIPSMNNTTPQPPTNNGTTMPPQDNGTTTQPPQDNGTTTTPTPVDNASIFISAKDIHSTDIGNSTIGVRVLPPVPGFQWDGDVVWQSTANVTLVAIQSDGTTSVSQESSTGALHFTAAALEFQSVTGQPVDVTYTVQAHLQNAP